MKNTESNKDMQQQWNDLAELNPYYAIDAISDFENPSKIEINKFFQRGRDDVKRFMTEMNIDNPESKTIVEIGCGIGRMSNTFADYFRKVIAFDISDKMLIKAKTLCNKLNIDFRLTSGSNLNSVKNGSVDVVFSYIVFQHIIDINSIYSYLEETSRVLKKDGMAYIQIKTFIPDFKEEMTIVRIIKKNVKKLLRIKKPLQITTSQSYLDLEEKFTSEYSVWRGSRVNLPDLLIFLKQQKFEIVSITGADTQYTFFKLIKNT